MNKKITFPQLAATLAGLTSSSEQTAESFLRELLNLISETLSRGESITIKGLGSFAPGLSDDNPVIWSPDEGLAEAVNRPFAFFEPVVLADGVNEEMLEQSYMDTVETEKQLPAIPPIPKTATVIPPEIPKIPIQEFPVEEKQENEPEPTPDTEIETEAAQLTEQVIEEVPENTEPLPYEPEPAPIAEPEAEPEPAPETDPEPAEEYYDNEYQEEPKRFNPWWAFLIGLLAGAIIGYFAYYFINDRNPVINESEVLDNTTKSDTVVIRATEESVDSFAQAKTGSAKAVPITTDTIITEFNPIAIDTVTTSRYLTTMSRKYYGDYRFWIYIYLENDSVIKNPNRIKPGTAIKIPDPKKYDIDANDPQSVKRAEALIAKSIADKRQ